MRTKQDVIDAATRILKLPKYSVSSGSSEPKEFLIDVALALDVPLSKGDSKPRIAQKIVGAAGFPWFERYESRGSTITLDGLEAVFSAVTYLTRHID